MSETVITVQGSAWTERAPERASVHVTVTHDGPDRESVVAATSKVADALTAALRGLLDPTSGPVTAWSSDRVTVWAERPWNNEGAQLPLVHHAAIGLSATFTDFEGLARWVERAAVASGVTIASIDWDLLDATRDELLNEMRTRAVRDAAAVYAQAIGLTSVQPTAIADAGMLGIPEKGGAGGDIMPAGAPRMMKASSSIEFSPAELRVSAVVDARFLAS